MKKNRSLLHLICFASALGGLAAFSGCTNQTLRPIPKGQNIVRTAEELRVVRRPLEDFLPKDGGTNELSVTAAGGKTLSLFLDDHEAALLKTADRSRIVEVHYWYHEADYRSGGFGDLIGAADLESIQEGKTVLIDRTRCRLHNQIMTRRPVQISYGLPMREFVEALYHDFPNAAVQLGGCVITNFSAKDTPAYVCSVCDTAYQTWRPTSEKERVP